MVYPEPAPAEVERFCAVQKIYRDRGLRVPRIDEVLDDQVVLQEDAGDLLLQRAWRLAGRQERRRLLDRCREILAGLAAVPAALATSRLDAARRRNGRWIFSSSHFFPRFPVRSRWCRTTCASQLRRLVGHGRPGEHLRPSRLPFAQPAGPEEREIVMVDFQDSLLAPRYYDLVSLAFDSYLDLGAARAACSPTWPPAVTTGELRQLRLTALQRNIKALGTFAFQTFERRHSGVCPLHPAHLRHIQGHLNTSWRSGVGDLSKYFDSVISVSGKLPFVHWDSDLPAEASRPVPGSASQSRTMRSTLTLVGERIPLTRHC